MVAVLKRTFAAITRKGSSLTANMSERMPVPSGGLDSEGMNRGSFGTGSGSGLAQCCWCAVTLRKLLKFDFLHSAHRNLVEMLCSSSICFTSSLALVGTTWQIRHLKRGRLSSFLSFGSIVIEREWSQMISSGHAWHRVT